MAVEPQLNYFWGPITSTEAESDWQTKFSIAVVMKLTAIIAVNLGVVRLLSDVLWVLTLPPVLFLTMLLDLALLQAVAFGQPLRTFYFTFLVVGVLSTGVITILTSRRPWQPEKTWGTLHILETTIQHYRTVRGQAPVTPLHIEFPELAAAEQWITYILVGLLPTSAAVLASFWMRRRGRRRNNWGQAVIAFLRGALIGFGLYLGARLVFVWFLAKWLPTPPAALTHIYWAWFVASALVGGLAVTTITWLRSREEQREKPP